jgi:hypothetical protein
LASRYGASSTTVQHDKERWNPLTMHRRTLPQ